MFVLELLVISAGYLEAVHLKPLASTWSRLRPLGTSSSRSRCKTEGAHCKHGPRVHLVVRSALARTSHRVVGYTFVRHGVEQASSASSPELIRDASCVVSRTAVTSTTGSLAPLPRPSRPVSVCHVAQASQGLDRHPQVLLRFFLHTGHNVLCAATARKCYELSSLRDGSSGMHTRTPGTTSTFTSCGVAPFLCWLRFVELVLSPLEDARAHAVAKIGTGGFFGCGRVFIYSRWRGCCLFLSAFFASASEDLFFGWLFAGPFMFTSEIAFGASEPGTAYAV